jgi:hypothetical protein
MNPNGTPANLKPFKAGKEWTGNAGGRPKKRPITDEYFALANIEVPASILKKMKLPAGLTFSQANALRRFLDALTKNGHQSSKEIRESIEGKAPMRLEITGTERKVITILVKHDRRKELSSSTLNIPSTSSNPSSSNGHS